MEFDFGQYDGSPFAMPDDLFPSPKLVQFILAHGQDALDAMDKLSQEDGEQYIEQLLEAGLLERDEQTGKLRMTPRMVSAMEHQALMSIFAGLNPGVREGHPTQFTGQGTERSDGTRPYRFGDRISDLDLLATLRHAIHHASASRREADDGINLLPVRLTPSDFHVHQTEGQGDVATCVLLDMSGSMMRYGRFLQAKAVAMGLASLVRSRFALDTVDFVGFFSWAQVIPEKQLPLMMPKPVSIFDPSVRLRMPLDQVEAHADRLPQHFTNLQLGMRMARRTLARRQAANKQMLIITDGQPTAHVEASDDDPGSEMLYLLYPPSQRTADATLREAKRCTDQGIRIASFALIDDYWAMDWVGFIDQLTRLTRGTAMYCSSDDLASTVIESYINGRRKRSYVG